MSEWLLARGLPYRDSTEKAYSTDANIWGATHEAKVLEHLEVGIEIVDPIMGVRFWDPAIEIAAEDVTIAFEQGRPVTINGKEFDFRRRPGARGQRHRGPARPGHVRPDREPGHRGQEPGHLRGTGNGAAARVVRAAGQRDPQRGHPGQLPQRGTAARRLLYEGRWLDPQALMLRESLQRWVGTAVTGEVTLRLRRGEDYSILDTSGPAFSYHPDKLSMERTEDSAFGPADRIGQLTMRNLDIADSRAKLEQYAELGILGSPHPALTGAAQTVPDRAYRRAAPGRRRGDRLPRPGPRRRTA